MHAAFPKNGVSFNHKRSGFVTRAKLEKHYAKRNKPDTNRGLLDDFTYTRFPDYPSLQRQSV